MSNNRRATLTVVVIVVVAAMAFNAAFFVMWAHGTAAGVPYNGGYGPGRMMPWMWGGMGAFWIFPVAAFLMLLVVFGFILTNFADRTPYRNFPGSHPSTSIVRAPHGSQQCAACGKGLAPDWLACPYCGAPRTTAGDLQARQPSDETK